MPVGRGGVEAVLSVDLGADAHPTSTARTPVSASAANLPFVPTSTKCSRARRGGQLREALDAKFGR
jgi:hypothetical protein